MRNLTLLSALCTVAGYAVVHFAFFSKPAPVAQQAETVTAEPVVLANVVEVTDTEALLDTVPAKADGVPFDAPAPAELTAPAAVERIPLAD